MKISLLFLFCFFVGCARYSITSQSRMLYADKNFMSGDITVDKGCSMVVLPVVYKGESMPLPSVETLAKPLLSRQDFLSIYSLENASVRLAQGARDSLLLLVPEAVKEGNLLKMGAVAPLIRKAGIAFFQTVVVKDMASVRTEYGKLLRKVKLEIEIWDTKRRQVLWRAEAEARTVNQRLSDEEVLMSSIKELYQLLPKFYFSTVHESW